ncbi:MAG TPA: ABC transporter substrate-binding protein [Symbiobacteriaceae bacterium]|nr:ABC transporter substrate-binding protein [Symbiobacteriaceae bacterium]
MRLRIRRAWTLALALSLVMVLSACGGTKTPNQPAAQQPAPAPAEKVTITFWHSWGENDIPKFERIATEFMNANPNIIVKMTRVPGGETDTQKLMTAVTAGTGPDVYLLDRFIAAQRAEAGVLEDLSALITASNFDTKQFYDWGIKECTWKGKVWCLPVDTDTRMLFYNKDHFKEAGLDPEKPPKTIDELDQMADKLTKKEGNKVVRYGFIPWQNQGWHYTWGWAFGAKFYDEATGKVLLDEPAFVKSLEWQAKYGEKVGKQLDPFAGASGEMSPFIAGLTSMVIDNNYHMDTINRFKPNFNYGVALIPTAPGVQGPITWAGGWSVVIPKGSKHPKEAFEFLKYYVTKGQEYWVAEHPNSMPVLKKAAENHPRKGDPVFKQFIDLLAQAKVRPALPVGAIMWDEMTLARDKAITGQASPADAAKAAQQKVQAELDKVMKK